MNTCSILIIISVLIFSVFWPTSCLLYTVDYYANILWCRTDNFLRRRIRVPSNLAVGRALPSQSTPNPALVDWTEKGSLQSSALLYWTKVNNNGLDCFLKWVRTHFGGFRPWKGCRQCVCLYIVWVEQGPNAAFQGVIDCSKMV